MRGPYDGEPRHFWAEKGNGSENEEGRSRIRKRTQGAGVEFMGVTLDA